MFTDSFEWIPAVPIPSACVACSISSITVWCLSRALTIYSATLISTHSMQCIPKKIILRQELWNTVLYWKPWYPIPPSFGPMFTLPAVPQNPQVFGQSLLIVSGQKSGWYSSLQPSSGNRPQIGHHTRYRSRQSSKLNLEIWETPLLEEEILSKLIVKLSSCTG